MQKTVTLDTQPRTKAQYEAAIDRYISQMEQMQQHIAENRREIERLRAETRAMLAEIKQG